MTQQVQFVVQDENLFGYINPAQPNVIGILATSTIRGCIYGPFDGMVPSHPTRQRPATRQDFQTFRVSPTGYMTDPRYNFPVA